MKTLEQAIQDECKKQGKQPEELSHLELDGRCKTSNLQALSGLHNLVVLSLCNTGLSSLADCPLFPKLQTLRLSDNKLSGAQLQHLATQAPNLKKLDLAGNAGITKLEQLQPLKQLKLKALDLDGCPVKDLKDIHANTFKMLDELEYLDNIDRAGIEHDGDEEDDDDDEDFEGEEGGDDAGEGEDFGEGEDEEGEGEVAAPDYAALLNEAPLEDDEGDYEDEGGEDDEDDDDEDEEEAGGSEKKRKRGEQEGQGGRDDEEEEDDDDE